MKKFETIEELFASEEFKKKDLSYCDLSNLDLSGCDSSLWCDFLFFHTNFSNTNIVFDPTSLKLIEDEHYGHYCLEYCDFSNCDLSYLVSFEDVSIKGSNFLNTGLEVYLDRYGSTYNLKLTDVIFSEEMASEAQFKTEAGLIDIKTVKLNPHINFSSCNIYDVISYMLPNINTFIPSSKYEYYNAIIDEGLEEDRRRSGKLLEFYNQLSTNFTLIDKIRFFQGIVSGKNYNSMDFSQIPLFLFTRISFVNCRFSEVTLPDDTLLFDGDGMTFIDKVNNKKSFTKIPHIIIPKLDSSSWKGFHAKRFGDTCFTRFVNLYLELGRKCNGKCFFCRNKYLVPCKYDFESIFNNLNKISSYLHAIVIGGGEPTLMRDHLEYLLKYKLPRKNYYVSTNASCDTEYLKYLLGMCNINISRHAIEDKDNNAIFKLDTLNTEEIRKLSMDKKNNNNITLVATLFKNGIDSIEKIEDYIGFSEYVQAAGVLFQNLHEDLTENDDTSQIDDAIFDEIIIRLKEQGYLVSEIPIYSTGDYKLIIAKSSDGQKTISFKKYITKEELEKEWYRSAKRTFDLSMSPDGTVYENWHQGSNKVLTKEI